MIRAVRPDVVLGHDPWKRTGCTPTTVARASSRSTGSSPPATPTSSPSAGTPHRPSRLLLFEAQDVDHVEAVDALDVDTKVEALLCHHSQWRSTMGIEEGSTRRATSNGQRSVTASKRRSPRTGGEPFKLLTEL